MELSLEEIIKMKKIRISPGTQGKRFPNKTNDNTSGVGRRINGRNDKPPRQPLQGRRNMNPGGRPIDARMKIIQKNRQRLTDARDKLAEIAKQTDARTKIKRRKMSYQNGRQDFRGRTNQRNHIKNPIILQRSIRNTVATNMRDPSSLIRCTINRTTPDFNRPYGDMDIDEPISVGSHNNYGGIQVALQNEYTPYARQEYIPSQDSYSGSYRLPNRREVEPTRNFQRVPESRRMSIEMRARLDTPPRQQRPVSPSPPPQSLGYRIVVSNLHSSVTHEDIKELFEDIGPLLTSRLVRPGTAEVIYKYQKDAKKAVEAYHNRQLDGQPMKCLLVLVNVRPTSSSSVSGVTRSSNMPAASKFPNSSRSMVVPDLTAIHKALFTHK